MENIEGFYNINKPYGISSQRAVQVVKYWARKKTGNKKIRVGHGGTLDPLATGVLVVAIGRDFTKKIDDVVKSEKEYVAQITLGMESVTDDAEGDKTIIDQENKPSYEEIGACLKTFIGDVAQIPPAYSAIKISGQEAYKRVRRGEVVEMQSRIVHIDTIDIISYTYPQLIVRVTCGKGTYIRSLARDIGRYIKVGAYLSGLQRTQVGEFHLEQSHNLDEFNTQLPEQIKIAIHAKELEKKRIDGTTVYLYNVLRRLHTYARNVKLDLYYSGERNPQFTISKRAKYINHKILEIPLWTQTIFAYHLWRDRCDVLWMPLQNLPRIRRKKMSTVVTIHDLAFKYFPETYTFMDCFKLNLLTDYAVKNCTSIIAVSHATKKDLLHFYPHINPHKIHVIHHGFDVTLWHGRCDQKKCDDLLVQYGVNDNRYIVHIGAIQPRKNLITLIKAFEILKNKFPKLQLVLIGGNGWKSSETLLCASQSTYAHDIIITGNIDFASVRTLMHHASVFALPSLYEGFGMPALEAMASDIPVVAANNSSLPEVLGDAALYFDAYDIKACATQIAKIISDSTVKEQLLKNARQQIKKFSWDVCTKKTLHVLQTSCALEAIDKN